MINPNDHSYVFGTSIKTLFSTEELSTFGVAIDSSGKSLERIFIDNDTTSTELDNAIKKYRSSLQLNEIRSFLSKYFNSRNLNFLLGNGCSVYTGSQTINDPSELFGELFDSVISEKNNFIDAYKGKIHTLRQERPEVILDKIHIWKRYEESLNNEENAKALDNLITKVKLVFLTKCILPINYEGNSYHKLFLKKVINRPADFSRVNIFTPNYDLLFEKSAEDCSILLNNGFVGFHKRSFAPESYQYDFFIRNKYFDAQSKRASNLINLYKLHGSISWIPDHDESNLYGIKEVPLNLAIEERCLERNLIYPIQNKKSHTLDLPYSELFRQFVENILKPNSCLFVIGYSFWDEHINDIIIQGLNRPDFHLVIHSFTSIYDTNCHPFLKTLIHRASEDTRISIFSGSILGNFPIVVRDLMNYSEEDSWEKTLIETFRSLKNRGETSNERPDKDWEDNQN